MKKAIFLDIDGTILDIENGITSIRPKVKRILKEVQSRGDYVFIATGRPYAFLNKELLEFGFDGFVLANGAHVLINNETVYRKQLETSFVDKLLGTLEKRDIQYILQGETFAYVKEEHEELYQAFTGVGIPGEKIVRKFERENIEIYKIEMLCTNKGIFDYCVNFIENHPEYDYFTSVNDRHLELYFKESTKAMGIQKAIEHLGVSIENTYAFGDGKNDIEMLAAVGCGIAMGNAKEEVKEYANVVTDTVHNDGVAKGIVEFVYKFIA